jgi:hypothetical protein
MNFESNIVVCPHCNETFEHNRINGVALTEAAASIEKQKRMYCKLSLDALERLEKEGKLTFPQVKKILLDNMNDFTRATHTIIGFGTEAE